MARFTRSLLVLLFAAVASTAHSAWAPETQHPGSTGPEVGRSALVKAAPRLTSMHPGAGADGSTPGRASALPAGLAPDASQAAGERFVGIMAYEGHPALPGQQLHTNGTVIVVQESSLELTVAPDGTVTGTGRLVMSRTGSGTPPCADYAVRTLSLTGEIGKEGQAFMAGGSGVQAAVLSGMFKYETRASKVGEAIADCNFGAQHGSGLMGYLTNEPGFAAGSGPARVTDRFFILYDGYAQRGLAHELEKSLRLDPEDFGEHVVGVLSSTAGLVHAAVPAGTDDGPIVVRLDYGGVVPKVIPTRGDQRDATLGGPIREGEVLVVEDDAFVVLQFDDGTTVAVRPGAHFTSYPASLRPEARSRRIPMALPNGRYASLVPDQRYGVFCNRPTVGGQVRTVMQDAADCMYRLGEGMHDFLVAPPRQPGDRFRAETNSVSTGVQGTVFRMIDDGTATTVQVVEGRVSVTPKGGGLAGIHLAAGSQVRVTLSGVGPIARYSPDTDARDVLGILVAAANAARPVSAPSIAPTVPTVPSVGAGGAAPAAGGASASPADRGATANQVPEVRLPDLSTPDARRRALVDAHAALGRILVEARAGRTVLIATSEPPGFLPVPRATLRAYLNSQIAPGAVTADSAQQLERQWTAGHDAALAAAERQFAELGALISSAGMAPAGRSVTSAAPPGPGSGQASRPAAPAAPAPAPVIASCDPPASMSISDGQEAGLLLRTGECVRGVLIDMGADFTMQVGGAERRIAVSDVALIDFMAGGSYADTDVSRGHVVALRTGATSRGELYDMSERRPLAVTIRGAGGEQRVSSAEIAYIALADVSARPTAPATPVPPPRSAPPGPPRAQLPTAGPPPATTPTTAGPGGSPMACADLSGQWTRNVNDPGRRVPGTNRLPAMGGANWSSQLSLTRRADGTYDVVEDNARGGVGTLVGGRFTYRVTWPSNAAGSADFAMNADCTVGSRDGQTITRAAAGAPLAGAGTGAGGASTSPVAGAGASIFGSWRACDGRMVAFAQEGAEIIGRYTAIGGLPSSLFSVGQVSHRLRPTGPGAYQGVVEHRYFDGRREWKDTVVTIAGDRYRDTGSDACSVDMTRLSSVPASTGGGAGPPAGGGAVGFPPPMTISGPPGLAQCSTLVGDWRRNDGMVVRVTAAGSLYRGVIVDPGAAAGYFQPGEHTFTIDAAPQAGVCTGQVLVRFADGRSEWRATRLALTQLNLFDTDNAGQWVRISAGTVRGAVIGSGGCGDLSGQWSHVTTGVGSSVFTLTARSDGRYNVTENGLGSGRGVAATSGNRLRYDFTWSGGAGFIDVVLNAGCTQGTGTLQFTAGQSGRFPSTLTRAGGQGEAGRMGTPSVESFAGAWDVESDGVRYVLTLTQNGNRVTGSYGDGQGAVEGTVTGQVLTLRWRHASGRSGTAHLALSADRGRFTGTYAAEASAGLPASRGAWNGVRRMR